MTSSAPPRFEPGSFRDPDTRVFHHAGGVFRGLTRRALADWQRLAKTRFYRRFSEQGRLVGTREVVERDGLPELAPQWAGVLEHARVPVVSYPYEWSFGMLRNRCGQAIEYSDAAARELLTRHFGAVTHETMASGTRTLYHCLPRSGDAPRASG